MSVINENTDKLNSTEQDAIKTLCNLWRREQFGQKCSDSVERMVNNLLKNENAHGGNQLFLKEALKDFRSISKELYTKDDETFRQFAAAAKEMLGGPQRTDEQQKRRRENDERRRKEAEQQQAQQQAEQQRKREQEERRKRKADQRSQQQQDNNRQDNNRQDNNRQNNNRQDNNRQGSQQQKGQNKLFLWGGLGALAVVVLAVIGYFVKTSLDNAAAEEEQRRITAMSLLLKGVWDGELEDRTAKLTIDSVKSDSVFGQVSVKQRRKTETHAVRGTMQLVDNTLWLSLSDQLDADARSTFLNGSYKLEFNRKEKTLTGTHTSVDSQEKLDMLFIQSGSSTPTKKSTAKSNSLSGKQKTAKSQTGEKRPGSVQTEEEAVPPNKGTGFKLEKIESDPSTSTQSGTGFKLEKINKEDMPI